MRLLLPVPGRCKDENDGGDDVRELVADGSGAPRDQDGGPLRCSACGESHDGDHECPEAPTDPQLADNQAIEVAGHTVYPDQLSILPCPVCGTARHTYYLGSRNSLIAGDEPRSVVVSGWLCSVCKSTLEVADQDLMTESAVRWSDMIVDEVGEEA